MRVGAYIRYLKNVYAQKCAIPPPPRFAKNLMENYKRILMLNEWSYGLS